MLSCNKCEIFGLSLLISNINSREMYLHYACRSRKKLKINAGKLEYKHSSDHLCRKGVQKWKERKAL